MLVAMPPSPNLAVAAPWQTLPPAPTDPSQLDNIKAHLDLVLLALESLAGVGSEAMLQAAAALNLSEIVSDRVSLWRLRQSSPLRKGQGGRKKLDVEEARALVLMSCYLARQQSNLLRQAIAKLEEISARNQAPHSAAILGDYLDRFCNLYQERMDETTPTSINALTHLALKLLIDLLFYSGDGGVRRLWLTLLEASLGPSLGSAPLPASPGQGPPSPVKSSSSGPSSSKPSQHQPSPSQPSSSQPSLSNPSLSNPSSSNPTQANAQGYIAGDTHG